MKLLKYVVLFASLTLGYNTQVFSQFIQITEGDTIYVCQSGPVSLHAQTFGIDSSALQTSSQISNCDDCYSSIVDIGFDFTYYGNTYNQCVLGSNAIITFNLGNANGYCQWPIGAAIPSSSNPVNAIMGAWEDLYPNAGATLTYATIGEAPNRIFVYNMCEVPHYSCTNLFTTTQMQLHETTNIIEFHITHKDLCTTWNSGAAILGGQDATGTLATVVNGYNWPLQWTEDNASWEMVPSGSSAYTVNAITYDPLPIFSSSQLAWTWNGSSISSAGDSVVINVSASGTAIVNFSAGCGSFSGSGADTIDILFQTLNTTRTRRISGCNNPADNALFITFQSPGPFQLDWSDSLGNLIATHTNISGEDSLTNIPSGGYTVLVTNADGCTWEYDYHLPIKIMVPDFTYSPNPLICQYQPVTFTNTSDGYITHYDWDFGDGYTQTTENPSHSYLAFGDSILVTLTISNDTFPTCDTTKSIYVDVQPNITALFASYSGMCAGDYITFEDQSYPYPVSWTWYLDGAVLSTDQYAYVTYPAGGDYPITLVVTDSLCGSDTLSDVVTVIDYPVIDLGNDTLLCPGEMIQLDAENSGATYLWTTGEVTQIITPVIEEDILVGVSVTNGDCTSYDQIQITMNCSMQFPNVFSPNGDGINDLFLPHLINMKSYDFYIYNRWGELIYFYKNGTGEAAVEGWNGIWHNMTQPVGVYVYYAKGFDIKDQPVQAQGSFLLMR